jgi:PAS domain S-box-containing protein
MPGTVPPARNDSPLFMGAALGLVVVIGLFSAAIVAYAAANERIDHTVKVDHMADEWLASLLAAETEARGYLITGQAAFLDPYNVALKRERASAAQVKSLVTDNETQVRNVEIAERDAAAATDRLRETVALVRAGHRDEAVGTLASGEGNLEMEAFREDIGRIRAEEGRLLVERRSGARMRAYLALFAAVALALTSFALLSVAWRLQRSRGDMLDRLAREARRRLETLSEIAVALSKARSRSEVAATVVELGMVAASADTCTLYVLDETKSALELVGERGVSPDVVDEIRTMTASSGNPPMWQAFASGTSLWVENEADYAAIFPAISTMKARGARAKAFWSVPLIAEGSPVGLLGMGFYAPRTFSLDERTFVATLGHQCAQALLRALRREGEEEAQRWFTTTLRSIGDAVIATDPEGRVTFVNPVAEQLTGYPEKDAIGRHLDDVFRVFSEQTGLPVESPVARVLREGSIVGLANHTVLRSRNGREVPIDDSGAPIRSDDGKLHGVVMVFRDVTHEKIDRVRREFLARAGEALVSSLDYQSILRTVADLAVPTIADFCTIDILEPGANAPVQVAMAHVDPAKIRVAKELAERYPRDPNAPRGVTQVCRTGKSEIYLELPAGLLESLAQDAEHVRLVKELRLESVIIVPLRVRGRTLGAMTFVYAESGRRYTDGDLVFAEDFARRAAMAIENAMVIQEVEQARTHEHALRDEAEIASRAKDEFLAMVSHELRTPLTAILGWAVMLRERSPGADVDRGLAVIERNARAQTKLIEDVLDVSRIISGKLSLSVVPTELSEILTTAIETVTPAASAKGIVIVADVPEPSLRITADADRLQQVVWNLLSNAVKFTPKGGSIDVRAYREGSEICISVHDTGEGIHADALPFVFEPFRQADASTTRRHGGLGLGLAIVKQLVSAHGGTVHAASEGEGTGATFVVKLPARSAVPAITRVPRASVIEPSVAVSPETPRLDGLRVLVVDDEEDALYIVSSVLREHGAEVHSSHSSAAALEEFSHLHPDVVVSDIGMPHMDGYALIRKIRNLPPEQGGKTPAVALTAYARSEDAQRAFAAGYQVHVTKPVEPVQLATVVQRLAGRADN